MAESRDGARREKLQRGRTQQLVLYPLVLLLFTFVVNTVSEIVRQRLRERYSNL